MAWQPHGCTRPRRQKGWRRGWQTALDQQVDIGRSDWSSNEGGGETTLF